MKALKEKVAAVSAVACIAVGGLEAAPADSAAPTTPTITNYAVQSTTPLPTTLSKSAAQSGSPSGAKMVAFDVPSGYVRNGPKPPSAYLYKAAEGYFGDYHCTGDTCNLNAEVAVTFNQYVYGGTSKRWSLYFTERTLRNSSLKHSYTYVYNCAVNIQGDSDQICGYGADRSPESGGVSPLPSQKNIQSKGLIRSFENKPDVINYPMYGLTIHWSDGVTDEAKYRGWDTCVWEAHTSLCQNSGDGR